MIASGRPYQEAAACSAPTYVRNLPGDSRVVLLLPDAEKICEELIESERNHHFTIQRFPFAPVSDRKFTSQLKCQAFVHAFSNVSADELILFVDADTCCLRRIGIASDIAETLRNGRIGMVADIEDRHFKSPQDPWYLTEQERLTYVNSGIIAASRRSLPMFQRFRALSEEPRFLCGPFNDQKVINFALGRHFPDRLALLERKYNWIGPPFSPSAMIAHFAGGAGYIGQQRRKIEHQEWCQKIKKGSGVWTA